MADPNTAFDPYTTPIPQSQVWSQEPTAPPLTPAPTPAPVPVRSSPQALTPGVPSQGDQTPGVTQWGDADDENEAKSAFEEEYKSYRDPRNVLSPRNNYRPVTGETKLEDHPDYENYRRLVGEIWPQLSKQEQAARRPALRAMEQKINADLKAQQAKLRQQQRQETMTTDAKGFDDPKRRDETSAIMGTHVEQKARDVEAYSKLRDPKVAAQYDFALKTSPLTTMTRKAPDGKISYEPLRNATTAIALLNGIPNEKAVDYAIAIGSPVGFDDKTGEPLPGFNGKKGRGAASYKVIGADVRDNVVIQMPDGTKLRIPEQLLNEFRTARDLGYKASKQWQADRKKAAEPGLIGRTLQRIIPEKGF